MALYAFTRGPELAAHFQIVPPIRRLFATASEIGVCGCAVVLRRIYSGNIRTFCVIHSAVTVAADSVSSSPSREVGSLCHYSNTMSGTLALYEPGRW